MKHIVLVGACYLDTILDVPYYPEEDSKLRAQSLTTRRGGNCPNTLQVLHQLLGLSPTGAGERLQTHLVSCLPDAEAAATSRIKGSFGTSHGTGQQGAAGGGAPVGIDFSTCIHREGVEEPASSFIFRSLETGSRTIVNYNGLVEMTLEEFKDVTMRFQREDESWWHFEGRIPDTTLECIQHLRHTLPNATISVEVEKPGRPGLAALAESADVVFYSRSWAENRGHGNAASCLEKETPPTASLALCTWGAQGATAYTPSDGRAFEHPVRRTDGHEGTVDVVDTIGAGDTFIAGMLYALTCHPDDWDAGAKLAFAVDLATLKVQREGFDGLARDAQDRL